MFPLLKHALCRDLILNLLCPQIYVCVVNCWKTDDKFLLTEMLKIKDGWQTIWIFVTSGSYIDHKFCIFNYMTQSIGVGHRFPLFNSFSMELFKTLIFKCQNLKSKLNFCSAPYFPITNTNFKIMRYSIVLIAKLHNVNL